MYVRLEPISISSSTKRGDLYIVRRQPLFRTNQLSIARSIHLSSVKERTTYTKSGEPFFPRSTTCRAQEMGAMLASKVLVDVCIDLQNLLRRKSKLIVVAKLPASSPGVPAAAGVKVPRKVVHPPILAARRPLPRGQRRPFYLPPCLLLVRFPRLLEGAVNLRRGVRRSGLGSENWRKREDRVIVKRRGGRVGLRGEREDITLRVVRGLQKVCRLR